MCITLLKMKMEVLAMKWEGSGSVHQLERAVWVSLVSGHFLSILLPGAYSGKPSLSVLGFGAILPAVVLHRKESADLNTFDV